MPMRYLISLLTLFLVALSFVPASAEIEWELEKSIPLGATPRDTAISSDGKTLFVLMPKGEVQVYSFSGELQETLRFGGDPDGLSLAPPGNRLYLKEGKTGEIRIVSLTYRYDIDTVGAPSKGPDDAPVTLVVFSDFQCPYCSKLVPVLAQIEAAYPEKVRIVFKNFPLRSHRYARAAAIAGLAADEQGKFWPLHDKLFLNYNRLNDSLINDLAVEAGLDMKRFTESLNNPGLADRISNDIREARRVGLSGTPTVYVNGRVEPNRSFEGLKKAIEEELSKKKE